MKDLLGSEEGLFEEDESLGKGGKKGGQVIQKGGALSGCRVEGMVFRLG